MMASTNNSLSFSCSVCIAVAQFVASMTMGNPEANHGKRSPPWISGKIIVLGQKVRYQHHSWRLNWNPYHNVKIVCRVLTRHYGPRCMLQVPPLGEEAHWFHSTTTLQVMKKASFKLPQTFEVTQQALISGPLNRGHYITNPNNAVL